MCRPLNRAVLCSVADAPVDWLADPVDLGTFVAPDALLAAGMIATADISRPAAQILRDKKTTSKVDSG
jgi:hypothetical protein